MLFKTLNYSSTYIRSCMSTKCTVGKYETKKHKCYIALLMYNTYWISIINKMKIND